MRGRGRGLVLGEHVDDGQLGRVLGQLVHDLRDHPLHQLGLVLRAEVGLTLRSDGRSQLNQLIYVSLLGVAIPGDALGPLFNMFA